MHLIPGLALYHLQSLFVAMQCSLSTDVLGVQIWPCKFHCQALWHLISQTVSFLEVLLCFHNILVGGCYSLYLYIIYCHILGTGVSHSTTVFCHMRQLQSWCNVTSRPGDCSYTILYSSQCTAFCQLMHSDITCPVGHVSISWNAATCEGAWLPSTLVERLQAGWQSMAHRWRYAKSRQAGNFRHLSGLCLACGQTSVAGQGRLPTCHAHQSTPSH